MSVLSDPTRSAAAAPAPPAPDFTALMDFLVPSGPDRKWIPDDDTLSQLLDEELQSDATFAKVLSSSPPQATPLKHKAAPLKHRTTPLKHRLTPLIKVQTLVLEAPPPEQPSSPPADSPPR